MRNGGKWKWSRSVEYVLEIFCAHFISLGLSSASTIRANNAIPVSSENLSLYSKSKVDNFNFHSCIVTWYDSLISYLWVKFITILFVRKVQNKVKFQKCYLICTMSRKYLMYISGRFIFWTSSCLFWYNYSPK